MRIADKQLKTADKSEKIADKLQIIADKSSKIADKPKTQPPPHTNNPKNDAFRRRKAPY